MELVSSLDVSVPEDPYMSDAGRQVKHRSGFPSPKRVRPTVDEESSLTISEGDNEDQDDVMSSPDHHHRVSSAASTLREAMGGVHAPGASATASTPTRTPLNKKEPLRQHPADSLMHRHVGGVLDSPVLEGVEDDNE